MHNFIIRYANHKDLNGICSLAKKCFDLNVKDSELRANVSSILDDLQQAVLVVINSSHIVGFIHARYVQNIMSGNYTEISEMGVLPYYQRRKCGTKLVLSVEKWCESMAVHNIKCILKSANPAVEALLIKCGYTKNCDCAFEKTIV